MHELDGELVRCFAAVFEDMPPERIRGASVDTVDEWDSVASVILLAVLEETFELEIDDLDVAELSSYAAVRDYVAGRIG
jgi:acyl carrier protein